MKDYLFQLISDEKNSMRIRNRIREYLQARILGSLQHAGAMIPLAFHGGTALRFLYHLPRFSQYLDFTLEHHESEYDIRRYLKRIQSDMKAEGYNISVKLNTRKIVHSCYIQFEKILYETGISPHEREKLSIKVEIDTKPPHGCVLKTSVIRHYVLMQLQHHDKSSMLAGKLHALFSRNYTKGRDLYDLFWYLSDRSWPEPNLIMLNNALSQTGWKGPELTDNNWRTVLKEKLNNLDWPAIIQDVRPYIEERREIILLTRENMNDLISRV